MTLGTRCAAGEPRMQQLDPAAFRPLPSAATDLLPGGRMRKMCHWCDQLTAVKRDGFFVSHSSSQQGSGVDRGQSHGKQGEPPRVQGRGK